MTERERDDGYERNEDRGERRDAGDEDIREEGEDMKYER